MNGTVIEFEDIRPGDTIRQVEMTPGGIQYTISLVVGEIRGRTLIPESGQGRVTLPVENDLDSTLYLVNRPEPRVEPGLYQSLIILDKYIRVTASGQRVLMPNEVGDRARVSATEAHSATEFLSRYTRVGD